MGTASWRVWIKHDGLRGRARHTLLIYLAKLFLIWMWPLIAFGIESTLAAVIEIGVLLYFVIFTGILFYRLDKLAGFLFIPYVAYVTFATVVCVHIYILNK
jgi:translocator protein